MFAKGQIVRPLLTLGRQDIVGYASQYQLQWVDDASNEDLKFDRNFIRHQVLPVIGQRWPDAIAKINRSVHWCREADELLTAYALEDLERADLKSEKFGESLSLVGFRSYPANRQKNILRFWSSRLGFSLPGAAQLDQLHGVLNAAEDGLPLLAWGKCQLRRYRERLYLLKQLPQVEALKSEFRGAMAFNDGSKLLAENASGLLQPILVQYRLGGERCQPLGRQRSQTLKKVLQEQQVPALAAQSRSSHFLWRSIARLWRFFPCANLSF